LLRDGERTEFVYDSLESERRPLPNLARNEIRGMTAHGSLFPIPTMLELIL
jgi:hypothetical protein